MLSNFLKPGMLSRSEKFKNNHVWHPFTSLQSNNPEILIDSAKGVHLYTKDGKKIIDAVSSWWVNIHGHGNEYLAEAIYKQALQLEHVIFAGFTHQPAINLAERLIKILPGNQEKIFFSDNGSTSVEVAIKMALQYWNNLGIEKKRIIALKGSYHGDTFGAMSVGERNTFNQAFSSYLFDVDFLEFPEKNHEDKVLKQFETLAKSGEIAAFVYEPLLQGAGGMRTYSASILDKILGLAKKHNIVCIADEVLTGFGRTGKLFASEYMENMPDIISLSKGLTGGTMPMGVTACNKKITAAFENSDKNKTFYHGHSYTANPLGCAAANASLDLLLKAECRNNIDRINASHNMYAEKIIGNKNIVKIHLLGTLISIEIKTQEESSYFNKQRDNFYNFFLERNILIRPLGNTIYILPPYIISNEELDSIYTAIDELLKSLEN